MKKIYLIWFFIWCLNANSQEIIPLSDLQEMNSETFVLNHPNNCNDNDHGDGSFLAFDKEKVKNVISGDSWARTLRFDVKFRSECEYDLGNFNQKDWNKLMFIAHVGDLNGIGNANSDERSIRLGWRWNLETNKMDLGLYAHINHDVDNSKFVGREFFYVSNTSLNSWTGCELIFGPSGLGIIVNDKGAYIKRRDILPSGYTAKTAYKKTAYFGGQECPPHQMKIDVSDAKGDYRTNWHNGACSKTFSRSIFYDYEDLMIFAAQDIIMSEQVYRGQYNADDTDSELNSTIPAGYQTGDEIPWFESDGERYVRIESGSELRLYAGNKIKLLPGFKAEKGSFFHAIIDNNFSCDPFVKINVSNQNSEREHFATAVSNVEIQTEKQKNINSENISQETSTEFLLYPNPSDGKFYIRLSNDEVKNIQSVSILDVFGREIQNFTEFEINNNVMKIDGGILVDGTYFVKVIGKQVHKIEKVTIKND